MSWTKKQFKSEKSLQFALAEAARLHGVPNQRGLCLCPATFLRSFFLYVAQDPHATVGPRACHHGRTAGELLAAFSVQNIGFRASESEAGSL